ncbi:MAG TPA: hypothetical protein VFW03_26525 [Gemmatimonadaceae bacterium]|nr:hypothetical protein [Gemmatimonadaceae bacterium]
MLINSVARNRSSLWALALVFVVVVAVVVAIAWRFGSADTRGGPPSEPAGALPPDVANLGTKVESIPVAGKISSATAVAAFEQAMGEFPDATKVEAFLVNVTDPELSELSSGRDVWVLKYSDVAVPMPIPNASPVLQIPDEQTGTLYAFVDAKTGEWLVARSDTGP